MAYHESYRLSDYTSIHAAEMMAIKRALEWATSVEHDELVIYTDSLGVLQAIEQRQSFRRPNLLRDLLSTYEIYCRGRQAVATFVWIPAHLGIEGNEEADMLAKSALNHTTVEMPLDLEYGEAQTIYRHHFLRKWQQEWANANTGAAYRQIQPQVDLSIKYKDGNRRKEVAISRLRFGHCLLNEQLYRWGRHISGNCDTCKVPETVPLFLMQCPDQATLQKRLQDECYRQQLIYSPGTILTHPNCQDIVHRYLKNIQKTL
jgi:ribonuclease HI